MMDGDYAEINYDRPRNGWITMVGLARWHNVCGRSSEAAVALGRPW